MAQKMDSRSYKVRLLGIAAALWCSLGWGAVCDFPSTALTNANPVYTYTIAIAPVVAGNIKVEWMTSLDCAPYQTLTKMASHGRGH